MYFGPWKFLGKFFSVKLDKTPIRHLFIALAMCPVHPLVPLIFYFSKEYREGTGTFRNGIEQCIGLGRCLQGFGLLDFGAVLIVAVPYWLLHFPTMLTISKGVLL